MQLDYVSAIILIHASFCLVVALSVMKWIKKNSRSIAERESSNLHSRKIQNDLSIVIPAYNESKRLPKTLRSLLAVLLERREIASEIIIVDDGSTDGTILSATSTFKGSLLSEPMTRCSLTTIRLNSNSGKGAAVTQVLNVILDELREFWRVLERSSSLWTAMVQQTWRLYGSRLIKYH